MKKGSKKNKNQFCTLSSLTELSKIREFVHASAIAKGFDDEQVQKIVLAVDEACTNLIKHAYNYDRTHEICLNIDFEKNRFIVNIYDDGAPFNPLEVNIPEMKEYFKNFKKGGLGIQIIRSVMDEIVYIPSDQANPKNKLSLIKSRS